MTRFNTQSFKKEPLPTTESVLMFLSILLLISALMCMTVAAVSVFLQGVSLLTIYLLGAATALGGVGIVSIKYLQRD